MNNNQIILSICIPTYNRAAFLEGNLNALSKQIKGKNMLIELIVSDNCSTDNTKEVVDNIKSEKFPIKYMHHDRNLGMDGNFISCLKSASGKYVWLLGDDDYLLDGTIETILDILKKSEIGLLHLNMDKSLYSRECTIKVYQKSEDIISDISYWITFISSNIVNTKYVNLINFDKYIGTYFTAIPLYLQAAFSEKENVILFQQTIDGGKNSQSNGGYNIFEVFIKNYLTICRSFSSLGYSARMLKKEKFKLYKNFLSEYIISLLIFKRKSCFQTKGAWKIILQEYMTAWYFLPVLLITPFKYMVNFIVSLCHQIQ